MGRVWIVISFMGWIISDGRVAFCGRCICCVVDRHGVAPRQSERIRGVVGIVRGLASFRHETDGGGGVVRSAVRIG